MRQVILLDLPSWAVVSEPRRAHIVRVTTLLAKWAEALDLSKRVTKAWCDAGMLHDALRDAPPKKLGRPAVDPTLPPRAWHGPAAARRLRAGGEKRDDVLDAITWHTVGYAGWQTTGRALYCADFLEPGRQVDANLRAALARKFPKDPTGVLREVVRMRLDRALRERQSIHARTVALWEVVR